MVAFPWLREELIYYLDVLADVEKQRQMWIHHIFPSDVVYDDFTMLINRLDDFSFFQATAPQIGYILLNVEEAENVLTVTNILNGLFDKYGTNLTDEQHMNCPEWTKVVQAANQALAILRKSDN